MRMVEESLFFPERLKENVKLSDAEREDYETDIQRICFQRAYKRSRIFHAQDLYIINQFDKYMNARKPLSDPQTLLNSSTWKT